MFFLFVCLLLQGFLDIDLTDLRKGGANITGFQLVNNSEPSVSRVVQQWLEFDIKDSKMPKSGLKVLLLFSRLLIFSVHLSPLGVWVATFFFFSFRACCVIAPIILSVCEHHTSTLQKERVMSVFLCYLADTTGCDPSLPAS